MESGRTVRCGWVRGTEKVGGSGSRVGAWGKAVGSGRDWDSEEAETRPRGNGAEQQPPESVWELEDLVAAEAREPAAVSGRRGGGDVGPEAAEVGLGAAAARGLRH